MAARTLPVVRRVTSVVGWLIVLTGVSALLIPTLLGFDRYVIVSGSMHPLLDRGSVVFSKPTPVKDLNVGDIITYVPPAATGVGHLVTHRISEVKVGQDGTRTFRTKGDANPGNDPWQFSLVKGQQNVMHFSIPVVGYALLALGNPHLRMLIIGIPAGIIGLISLVDFVRGLRRSPEVQPTRAEAA